MPDSDNETAVELIARSSTMDNRHDVLYGGDMERQPVDINKSSIYRQHAGAIVAVIIGCLPMFNVGCAIGFSSPAIRDFEKQSEKIVLSTEELTWFGSLLPLVAMFGSFLCGPIMETLGRRKCIVIITISFLVGWMLIFLSSTAATLFIGRSIHGLAYGMSLAVVPVYLGELCPSFMRGMLGTMINLQLSVGIVTVFGLGIAQQWRNLAQSAGCAAFLTTMLCWSIPESPYWLIKHGDHQAAYNTLKSVRKSITKAEVKAKINEITEISKEKTDSYRFIDLVLKPVYSKPILIVMILNISQHACGIDVVTYYTHGIFATVNFPDENIASLLVGLMQVLGMIIAVVLMDKVGRCKLMLISCFGAACCHAAFGICMLFNDKESEEVNRNVSVLIHDSTTAVTSNYSSNEDGTSLNGPISAWISLACTLMFVLLFGVGLGPIPFIAAGEMLPLNVRGFASGLAMSVNCMSAFFVIKTFRFLIKVLTNSGLFWAFGALSFLSGVFVWKYVPETKGKSLIEIQKYFSNITRSSDKTLGKEDQKRTKSTPV